MSTEIIDFSTKIINNKILKLGKKIIKIEIDIEEIENKKLNNLKMFLNSINSNAVKDYTSKCIEKDLDMLQKKIKLLEKMKNEYNEMIKLRDRL